MTFVNKLNSKDLLKLSLVAIGTFFLLNSSVKATQITPNSIKSDTQTTSLNVSSTRPILVAQSSICPEKSGGSQFATAETRHFLAICRGDLINTYVGFVKNGTTGGVILHSVFWILILCKFQG